MCVCVKEVCVCDCVKEVCVCCSPSLMHSTTLHWRSW